MSAENSGVECHHEWGALKEAMVGISPAEDFVIPVFYPGLEFMPDKFRKLSVEHGGERMIDVDSSFAHAIEQEVEAFAALLESHNVLVHRPVRLKPPQSTYLSPKAEGAQLFARDGMLVIDHSMFEIGMKIQWRRREVFGYQPELHAIANSANVPWSSMPLAAPPSKIGGEDEDPNNCFLAGGDVLLNGYDIYVGNSGLASNKNGIAWLQQQLGSSYRVHEIPIKREALHLDVCMMLVGPTLGLICRDWVHLDRLPRGLENYDWIDVTPEEASWLGCNVCVLDEAKIVLPDQQFDVAQRLKEKLGANLDLLWIDFENVVQLGGGLRCCHHPLVRESVLSAQT